MLPVKFYESAGNVPGVEVQWYARTIAFLHGEIGHGKQQCVLVAGGEQALAQQPLDVLLELDLFFGGGDHPQYLALTGNPQRIPPRASGESPVSLGMT